MLIPHLNPTSSVLLGIAVESGKTLLALRALERPGRAGGEVRDVFPESGLG